jgi:hypothetical protein
MAKIKAKRGLEANLSSITLDDGEFAIATDSKKLYVGIAGQKILIANGNALGDMLKNIYDTDNDGIVDQAEKVEWSGILNKAAASSVALGCVKVGSNLSVTPDGTLSGNSIPESFIPKSERFTIAGGQTIFNLTKGYYTPNSLTWSIFGFLQPQEAITEISGTSFSIPTGLADGTEFEVQFIQTVNLTPFPYHKSEHLPGGADDLGLKAVALSGNYSDLYNKPSIPTSLPANGGNADTVDNLHASDFYQNGSVVMNTNPFGGKRLYINAINNAMFNAHKRWVVTGFIYNANDTLNATLTQAQLATLFDGNYETSVNIPANTYLIVNVSFSTESGGLYPSYPYGNLYLSHYYTSYSQSATVDVFCNYAPQTVGWKTLTFNDFVRSGTSNLITKANNTYYALSEMKFKVNAPVATSASITQIDYQLDRPSTNEMPFLDKFRSNKLYFDLNMGANKIINVATPTATTDAPNKQYVDDGLYIKAPIASPTFTGAPKSTTPATSDNNTNIATTAFVKAQGYITSAGSGARITTNAIEPTSPSVGDFWYKEL